MKMMKPTNCGMTNHRPVLRLDDVDHRQRPGHHDHADDRQALGDLVRDQLRGPRIEPRNEYFEPDAQPPSISP